MGLQTTGATLPVDDGTAVVKGSSDATKQLRFEVDGFTAGQTRVVTFPDANITVARTDAPNSFANGTVGAPTIAFANGATTGIYSSGASVLDFSIAGSRSYAFLSGDFYMLANASRIRMGASSDLDLSRSAAGVLSVQAGSGAGSLLHKRLVTAKTTAYTVVAADSNGVFTNEGAAGAVTFTLPTPVAGLTYTFIVAAAQTVNIVPGTPASEGIYNAGTLDADDTLTNATIGTSVTLTAINATTWVVTAITGTW